MAEIYTLQTPENLNYSYDRRLSSASIKNNSRSSLISEENSYEQRPQMYYLRLNDGQQKSSYDQQKLSSSSIDGNFRSSSIQPELYHLKVEGNDIANSNYRSSSVMINAKRKSSIPYQSLNEQKPEVYYISAEDKNPSLYNRRSPFPNNIHQQNNLNEAIIHSNSSSEGKIITYMIKTPKEDEFQSPIQRTPSSRIRRSKKKPIVSCDMDDDDNGEKGLSNKQDDFPIGPHDVSAYIRYVPLSQ
ncbi:unnamed protein product [Rotaria sp. Silwood2]|nr:unnamed protein product [Rotaria sp. Silwood2]CAF2810947.1 unnamed protein product [Rotaria sp. Silwood2]CAF3188782.1 unnamed protein product [Rotaria sp. Silwood2]CAF3237135.1 unnamed protein product [Rotaria sp. Silwood2]CAF4234260.1 unnamed protein product [Rotaria sp. Silwood2]